jgi:hypothetical protein
LAAILKGYGNFAYVPHPEEAPEQVKAQLPSEWRDLQRFLVCWIRLTKSQLPEPFIQHQRCFRIGQPSISPEQSSENHSVDFYEDFGSGHSGRLAHV